MTQETDLMKQDLKVVQELWSLPKTHPGLPPEVMLLAGMALGTITRLMGERDGYKHSVEHLKRAISDHQI